MGADVEKKRAFFEQVSTLEKNYPGGSLAYTKNAQELLRSSAAGENPFEGMAPEVRIFPLRKGVKWVCVQAAHKLTPIPNTHPHPPTSHPCRCPSW